MKNLSRSQLFILCLSVISMLALFSVYVGPAISDPMSNSRVAKSKNMKGESKAIFAGGCFWCMEKPFEDIDGVTQVLSGYIGGHKINPTYQQVTTGRTGHTEAVEITYDPAKVSYETLLDVFWHQIDPTDAGGSFVDRGSQYRSGIFYVNEEQQRIALQSKKKLGMSKLYMKPIVTEVTEASKFYVAEDYHQDYYKRNPLRYKFYRYNSGRDQYLAKVAAKREDVRKMSNENGGVMKTSMPERSVDRKFVKPSKEQLRERLTSIQYEVTQEDGTERSFKNEYWDNKEEGIYVDIVSGEPLFSSTDKFTSGTGWPSFTKPILGDTVVTKKDRKFFMTRVEVRSRHADSHLGHVFEDGPKPTGLRYCINSASLQFVPKTQLEEKGYGQFASLFK